VAAFCVAVMPINPTSDIRPIAVNLTADGGVMPIEPTRYFPQAELD